LPTNPVVIMTLQALSSIGTGLTLVNTPSASTQASTKSTPTLRRRRTDTAKVVNDIVREANKGTAPRETNSIWLAVIDGHLERLKPEDRAQCAPIALNASVDELAIAAIFEPLRKKYEKDRFYRMLKRVHPIAEHVLSFGKAIDVAVGSGGSLSAGLIWGGIRILLAVRHLRRPVTHGRPTKARPQINIHGRSLPVPCPWLRESSASSKLCQNISNFSTVG
jgi:hypothetical protein